MCQFAEEDLLSQVLRKSGFTYQLLQTHQRY
jgi:hypothetical protein